MMDDKDRDRIWRKYVWRLEDVRIIKKKKSKSEAQRERELRAQELLRLRRRS